VCGSCARAFRARVRARVCECVRVCVCVREAETVLETEAAPATAAATALSALPSTRVRIRVYVCVCVCVCACVCLTGVPATPPAPPHWPIVLRLAPVTAALHTPSAAATRGLPNSPACVEMIFSLSTF
jgi:hypothetical protein